MSGVLNDCDALLQEADVRILNPDSAFISLSASAPGFHMTGAGTVDLATVTITADLVALDGDVVFSGQGVTLSNVKARSVDATYVNGTGIVTATVVTNGETFTRSYVIPVLRDGAAGAAGQPVYTWIKYADTAAGAGLSDDPAGKTYIGLAHNKSTATESTTPGDYTWALMKGGDGLPGAKGADGITYYTWIKYADQADGTGLYDVPNANTLYIGIAVNRTTATESTTKTDYVWSRFKGEQGVAGAPTYTWIKYADTAAGVGLSDDPTGKTYIGFAYNKATATESTTAADYTWSLIKGTDGQPGGRGADGATLYTWIKYSDVADGTGLYDIPTASTLYIGIATNKSTATESTVKTDYVWSKFKGDQGVQGPTTYTWVKYADSAAGAGLSDDPTGKAYIGFAYNKTTATESTTATDYTWSLIKGTDGQPGGKGADGQTLYTWIKYSDNADGTGLYDLPTASTQYLGIAVNKTTATESTVKTDYVWSKFRGADGVGTAGARGAGHYYVAGSSWSDIAAQAACPGGPVTNDVVTISSGTFVMEKRWTGSAWVDNGVVIDGKLIVPSSILASAIDTRNLTIRDAQGNIVVSAGGLQSGFEAPGTKNSDLDPVFAGLDTALVRWDFAGNAIGFTAGAADLSFAGNGDLIWTPTGSNPYLAKGIPSGSQFVGSVAPKVRALVKRLSGAGTWEGRLMYTTAGHGNTSGYSKDIPEPLNIGDWMLLEWDMSNLDQGGSDWMDSTITAIRIDLVTSNTGGSSYQIDWIGIGKYNTGASLALLDAAARNAKSANDAIPGINTAIADKLSKTSASSLAARVTLATNGSILSGTTTNGTYMDPSGFYGVQGGVVKFSVPISGDPTFGGTLTAAGGTIGSISIPAGGSIHSTQYPDYVSWLSGTSAGFFLDSGGAVWGNHATGETIEIYVDGGKLFMPGFRMENKQLTLTNPILVNPKTQTTLSVSLAAMTLLSQGNGDVNFTRWPASISNGSGSYDYDWSISGAEGTPMKIMNPTNTDHADVRSSGFNIYNISYLTLRIKDRTTGATAASTAQLRVQHGTGQL